MARLGTSARNRYARTSDYDSCPQCGGQKSRVAQLCRPCRFPRQSPARFLKRKVVSETGCWLWTGPLSNSGYAKTPGDGRPATIHRLLYEFLVGPVEAGKELHHTCGVRHCINPAHLQPMTRTEHRRAHLPRPGRRRAKPAGEKES